MSSGNSNNEVPEYSEKEVEKLRYQVIRQVKESKYFLKKLNFKIFKKRDLKIVLFLIMKFILWKNVYQLKKKDFLN